MVPARSREVLESRIERGPRMQQRGYYPYYRDDFLQLYGLEM
ncbi:MAG TPA: hypothetical protein VMW53_10595 [archaeon]|nr:hypothetical protein [archaeon]